MEYQFTVVGDQGGGRFGNLSCGIVGTIASPTECAAGLETRPGKRLGSPPLVGWGIRGYPETLKADRLETDVTEVLG